MDKHEMRESTVIKAVGRPITQSLICEDLRKLGVAAGSSLLVHSSLSSLGWVVGGAPCVILALENSLTEVGTLVMPAFTGHLSDPAAWCRPPVPEGWWQTIREEMPPFMPDITGTRGVGVIPETFRKQNGVVRSMHPQGSFAAWGKNAETLTTHTEDDILSTPCFGITSPLGKLYEQGDVSILLLGTDYSTCTSLHLAEVIAKWPSKKDFVWCGAPVLSPQGDREWRKFKEVDYDEDDFQEIGAAFEKDCPHHVTTGKVGNADAKVIHLTSLVDYAIKWMEKHRK